VADVRRDPALSLGEGSAPGCDFFARDGLASVAILPIGIKDERVGLLVVGFRTQRVFSPTEQSWLNAIAQTAALHLLRVRHNWLLLEGLAMPELNIHDAVHEHESIMQNCVHDLRSKVNGSPAGLERLGELLGEIEALRRDVLLGASGARPEFSKDRLSETLRKSANVLERAARKQTQIEVTVAARAEAENRECKLLLYRIAGEAMNNAVRYGRPGQCSVSIQRESGRILVEVQHDGAGFDPEALPPERHGRYGIFTLLQLAREHFLAEHEWLGAPGNRTGLRVIVPALPRLEELVS
jgi:nitrate/nitrite-specific signal transduction histidine kinase